MQVPKHASFDKVVSISTVFFFHHTIFWCETALFENDQITKQCKVTPFYDLFGTHYGVEIVLHLTEHALMILVPIYMFSMGAGTKTCIV